MKVFIPDPNIKPGSREWEEAHYLYKEVANGREPEEVIEEIMKKRKADGLPETPMLGGGL